MTSNVAVCGWDDTVARAARLMREHDCGIIPVVEVKKAHRRLVGLITDRDITCRVTAEERAVDTPVHLVMSRPVFSCSPDDDVEDVERLMAQHQVRRIPVVDESGDCLGMVSLADIARRGAAASENEIGWTVAAISEAQPHDGRVEQRVEELREERGATP